MDLHQVQLEILRTLLFNPKTNFSKLNKLNLSSDHLAYHIKQLTQQKLIYKNELGEYVLTDMGKEAANRLDTENAFAKLEKQPKVGVLCHIWRANGDMLVQTRLKEPFFGYKGGISGKVKYGESLFETAEREVLEETGLTGTIVHHGFVHHINYKDNQVVEDKLLAIFSVTEVKGELLKEGEGFANTWMSLKDYKKEDKIYDGELDIIEMIHNRSPHFIEVTHTLEEF